MPDAVSFALAFAAAFLAGAINSVAGGGTLITFPALLWLGLPSIVANATNTAAIWPASLGGAWGYRKELTRSPLRLKLLAVPSLVGGMAGALLLHLTPERTFEAIVPFLLLFATILFLAQQPLQKLIYKDGESPHESTAWLAGAMVFQLLVGVYGGYFGAGMGILMLGALSLLGLHDIHQMNGLKNLFGFGINLIAAIYFTGVGLVNWPYVAVMAVGATLGGNAGAGMARKMGRSAVRVIVISIGLGIAIWMFVKRFA